MIFTNNLTLVFILIKSPDVGGESDGAMLVQEKSLPQC